jgi:hypothetical protein
MSPTPPLFARPKAEINPVLSSQIIVAEKYKIIISIVTKNA